MKDFSAVCCSIQATMLSCTVTERYFGLSDVREGVQRATVYSVSKHRSEAWGMETVCIVRIRSYLKGILVMLLLFA